MKKLIVIILALSLIAVCLAEDSELLTLAKTRGFEVEVADNDGGAACCDYAIANNAAVMTWTEAARRFTATGDSAALSRLYLDALARGGWEACRYVVNGEAQLSFGCDSARRFDTLEAYAGQLEAAPGFQDAVNSPSGVAQAYVLNQRTKKFHHPDCSGIRDMNPKNREDFTGTRDELIAMGYSPCGICKP